MKDIINTYGETVIGICAIIIVMMLVGMSMAAYRKIGRASCRERV